MIEFTFYYRVSYARHSDCFNSLVVARYRPFYRTEMLIVTARNSSRWYHELDSSQAYRGDFFGPVLRNDVLNEVIASLVPYCARMYSVRLLFHFFGPVLCQDVRRRRLMLLFVSSKFCSSKEDLKRASLSLYSITTGRNRVRLEELVGDRERWKDITAASMAGRAFRMTTWPDL
jgi:hypothetical protein